MIFANRAFLMVGVNPPIRERGFFLIFCNLRRIYRFQMSCQVAIVGKEENRKCVGCVGECVGLKEK